MLTNIQNPTFPGTQQGSTKLTSIGVRFGILGHRLETLAGLFGHCCFKSVLYLFYSASGFQSGSHLKTGRNAREFSNSQVPSMTAMYFSSGSPIRDLFFDHFGTHVALICGHLGTFGHHFGVLGVPLATLESKKAPLGSQK